MIAEARAWLALGAARKAEEAIRKATRQEPARASAWLLWLELLRLEDRQIEAAGIAREALGAVGPADRLDVLRAATLALLADAPDEVVRPTLEKWVAADSQDIDAKLALMSRKALAGPRQAGPASDRASGQVSLLQSLLNESPGHIGLRAATVGALAEAGLIDRGRSLLDTWPKEGRDARYERLEGRWKLEYERKPDEAEEAFRKVLAQIPHDWKTRTRLARALHAQGRDQEARAEAETVSRHRELLEPARLGPRLSGDLEKPEDPEALEDLAALCQGLGLNTLAEGWSAEAAAARRARAAALRVP